MKLICAFLLFSLCLVARSDSFDDILARFFETHPEVNKTATTYVNIYSELSSLHKNDPECVAKLNNKNAALKDEYKKRYESGNLTLEALVKRYVEAELPFAISWLTNCLLKPETEKLFTSMDQQGLIVLSKNRKLRDRYAALSEQRTYLISYHSSIDLACKEIVESQMFADYVLDALKLYNNKTTPFQLTEKFVHQTLPKFNKKFQLCLTGDDNTKFDTVAYWYLEANPNVNATWLSLVNQFANLTSFQPHDEACAAPLRNIADMERQVKVYEFVNGKATIDEIFTDVLGRTLPAMIEEARACLINNPYAAVKNRTSFRFSRKI